jgi:hypothetical protein
MQPEWKPTVHRIGNNERVPIKWEITTPDTGITIVIYQEILGTDSWIIACDTLSIEDHSLNINNSEIAKEMAITRALLELERTRSFVETAIEEFKAILDNSTQCNQMQSNPTAS